MKFFESILSALRSQITIKRSTAKKCGNTKILVKNIGPGGLCFISNIKMPVKRHFIIQFTTELMGEEIKVCGHLVWSGEMEGNLYEYGVEFIVDENERDNLIRLLNQVQIKMKKDLLFAEGSFNPIHRRTSINDCWFIISPYSAKS